MLRYLHIKNIAIIDEIEIEFYDGLNIITGETGVGKSIIISSINFALGSRTPKDLIRQGTESCSVELSFKLLPSMIEMIKTKFEEIEIEGEEITIYRSLNTNGKNIFRINGVMVTSNVVKEVMAEVIDIHGQHEHQSLFDSSKHIFILDRFAKAEIEPFKKEMASLYMSYQSIKTEIISLLGDEKERERKVDLLKFQIEEIETAKLKEGEEIELLEQRKRFLSMDKIVSATSDSYELLDESVEKVARASSEIAKLISLDGRFEKIEESIREAEVLLADAKMEIKGYTEEINFEPTIQEEVEQRLDQIDKIKRKYGDSVQEILSYYEQKKEELDYIIHSEEKRKELQNAKERLEDKMQKICMQLTRIRHKNADEISHLIEENLKFLEMKNVQFAINLSAKDKFCEDGMDQVEFLFSSNLGEEPKPLSKIGSGGEISRVMLAIKNVLAGSDNISTMIFDEIDTGISGKAAQKVAEKISILSQEHQILCITHLAQIAAMADSHYVIVKEDNAERTMTRIRLLTHEEEVMEIARLVTGNQMTEVTREHAKELKLQASKLKKVI